MSCPKIGSSLLRNILDVERLNAFLAGDVGVRERLYGAPGNKRDRLLAEYLGAGAAQGSGAGPGAAEGPASGAPGSPG